MPHVGVRREAQALVHGLAAQGRQPEIAIGPCQRVACPRCVGGQPQRFLESGDGRARAALGQQLVGLPRQQLGAQLAQRLRIRRRCLQARLGGGQQRIDLGPAAVVLQQRHQPAQRAGVGHAAGELLAQQRLGLGLALLGNERVGEDHQRIGVVRLARQRLSGQCLGFAGLALRAGQPRTGDRAPEGGGVQQAAPLVALLGIELQRAGKQRARLVVTALAQPHQPEATDHLGIVAACAHRLLEGGLRFGEIAALELAQSALARLVGGIGQHAPMRLAPGLQFGQRLPRDVVVGHFLQIALEPDRVGGIVADAIQRAAPDIERGLAVGVGALAQPVQQAEAFGPRGGTIGQQVAQHQREARIVGPLRQLPAQFRDRARTARVGAGQDAVVVDSQLALRRPVGKQLLQAFERFLLVAAARKHAHRRHFALVLRGDAVAVLELARGRVLRMVLAQALQDPLCFGGAVRTQFDLRQQQQRIGLLRLDRQDLVERVARQIGAILGFPHARRRQQARQFRVDGRGDGGRSGGLRGGRQRGNEQHRGGGDQRRAGHVAVQAGVSAPSASKRYRPSRWPSANSASTWL